MLEAASRVPELKGAPFTLSPILDGNQTDADSNTAGEEVASSLFNMQKSIHPPPAFGSSTNLEALALEASKSRGQDHDSTSYNESAQPSDHVKFFHDLVAQVNGKIRGF
ncbi:hypothetical protein ABZP36_031417 [Zizania latifolia]